MAEIALHYFDLRGRVEVSRYLLNYFGAAYTDNRVSFEEWPLMKAGGFSEFSQLPMLEIDGLKLVQSRCISRYLAQKYGAYPTDPLEVYLVESLCDFKHDIAVICGKFMAESNWTGLRKTLEDNKEMWLKTLEQRLERNGGDGWFVGNSVSLADFEVFQLIYDYPTIDEEQKKTFDDSLDAFAPKLKEFIQRMKASSGTFREYLDGRAYSRF